MLAVGLTVTFAPYPITSGPAALVTMSKPAISPASSNTYTSVGNWTNSANLPYQGIYVLSTGFSGTIDPGSVVLKYNSLTMKSSWYTVGNNNTIVIVPSTLLVGRGQGVLFQLSFSALGVPSQNSIIGAGGYTLFPIAGIAGGFTVTHLLLVLMVAVALAFFGAVVEWSPGWGLHVGSLRDPVSGRLSRATARAEVLEFILLGTVALMEG